MDKKCVKPLLETKFVKVYDLQYEEGKHYFDATRHDAEHLTATFTDEEFKAMQPDAATCYVVVKTPGEEPKLLLNYEYRYPVGRYMLSVPAGLVDDCDKGKPNALTETAIREIKEETGLTVKPTDRVFVINPCVFSTPGLTDESNGLVGVVITLDDLNELNQCGAVGSECFDGFCLVNKEKALELIKKGTDDRGFFYPMFTFGALMWFAFDSWQEERG